MKNLVKAVFITTILSFLTKLISFILRIYISREIGAEALGYYQISITAFMVFCTLVTSGLPLVISRKITNDKSSEPKVVGAGLIIATTIATICSLLIIFFPNILVKIWGQKSSLITMYILLPAIMFTAIYVPIRGSFWGNKQFFTLGFIELIEQIIRFFACLLFFNITLKIAGENITAITYTIACTMSCIIALIIYFKMQGKIQLNHKYIKPLLAESIPLATLRILTSLVSMLISIAFPFFLTKTGSSMETAVATFGVITGMALPIITIPSTFIGSISLAILPEISNEKNIHKKSQINNALSYSIIFAIILFPALYILGEDIGITIFSNALAGKMIKYGSFILLPMGISQISFTILNALGKEKQTLIINLISSIFLFIPMILLSKHLKEYSLLLGFGLMHTASAILCLLAIKKYLNATPLKTTLLSIVFCIPCCILAHNSYNILNHFNTALIINLTISATISTGFMLLFLIIFKQINIKSFLPTKFITKKRIA